MRKLTKCKSFVTAITMAVIGFFLMAPLSVNAQWKSNWDDLPGSSGDKVLKTVLVVAGIGAAVGIIYLVAKSGKDKAEDSTKVETDSETDSETNSEGIKSDSEESSYNEPKSKKLNLFVGMDRVQEIEPSRLDMSGIEFKAGLVFNF